MTVKELYELAKEKGAENYIIVIQYPYSINGTDIPCIDDTDIEKVKFFDSIEEVWI